MSGAGTVRTAGVGGAAVAALLGLSVLVHLSSPGEGPDRTTPGAARSVPGVPPGAERARVVSHVDGDTIRLTGTAGSTLLTGRETTVRLLEVDSPEVGRDGEPGECYAAEASDALRTMLPRGAELWVTRDRELYDPYGRMLLYLWDEEGAFVNLELVRRGYARAVLFEPNDEHIALIRDAQAEARAAARGRWGAC